MIRSIVNTRQSFKDFIFLSWKGVVFELPDFYHVESGYSGRHVNPFGPGCLT